MIRVTEKATEQMKRLLEKKAGDDHFIRVGVKGGGCSGMSYSVEIDSKMDEFDKVFEDGPVKVVCDQKSMVYLDNIEIDFSEELVGGGFRFNNPNASGSCGCGISFSV